MIPQQIISSLDAIQKLYADIDNFDPSGTIRMRVKMGAPITRIKELFCCWTKL